MKRFTQMLAITCLLLLMATAAWAQTPDSAADPATLLAQLARDVQALKTEMIKVQLELQQAKLALARRELEQAQSDRRRAQGREGSLQRRVAEVEAQLSEPDLTEKERSQLEALKVRLATNERARVAAEQTQAAEQEAAVTQKIESERRRWQELADRAAALGIEVKPLQ